jgi:hypothetical protein
MPLRRCNGLVLNYYVNSSAQDMIVPRKPHEEGNKYQLGLGSMTMGVSSNSTSKPHVIHMVLSISQPVLKTHKQMLY